MVGEAVGGGGVLEGGSGWVVGMTGGDVCIDGLSGMASFMLPSFESPTLSQDISITKSTIKSL